MALDFKRLQEVTRTAKPVALEDSTRLQRAQQNIGNYEQQFLRGQAAEDYITANPNAGYNIIDDQTGQIQDRVAATRGSEGLVGDLAYGLISPFANLSAGLGDLASGAQDYRTSALAEPEFNRFQDNQLGFLGQQALGAGATAASFALPGAGSILKGASMGAGLGAADAFSRTDLSDPNADVLGQTLTGGLLGGATGGLIPAAGKAAKLAGNKFGKNASKVTNAADGSITKRLVKSNFDETADFITNAKNYKDVGKIKPKLNKLQQKGLLNQYKQLGFTTRKGSGDFVSQLGDDVLEVEKGLQYFNLPRSEEGVSTLFQNVGNLRDGVLENSGKTFKINIDDFANNRGMSVASQVEKLDPGTAKSMIYNRLGDVLEETTGDTSLSMKLLNNPNLDLPAPDLQRIKEVVNDGFLNTIGKGSRRNPAPADYIDAEIRNMVTNKLGQVPGYRNLNKTFEVLYTQNPGLRRVYDTGLKSGTFSASVLRNPMQGGADIISSGIGKAREATGNLQARLSGAGAPTLRETTPGIGKRIVEGIRNTPGAETAGRIGQNIAPIMASRAGVDSSIEGILPSGGDVQEMPMDTSTQQTMQSLSLIDELLGGGDGSSAQNQERAMMYNQLLNQGYSSTEAKTLTDMQLPASKSKKLPSGQLEKLAGTRAALQALDTLEGTVEQMSNRFGPVQGGLLGDITTNVLGMDPERAGLQSSINTLAQNLGKSLEGGKLTDADIERYRSMLPQLSDPAPVAKQKLTKVRDLITNGLLETYNVYSTGGYDPIIGE